MCDEFTPAKGNKSRVTVFLKKKICYREGDPETEKGFQTNLLIGNWNLILRLW